METLLERIFLHKLDAVIFAFCLFLSMQLSAQQLWVESDCKEDEGLAGNSFDCNTVSSDPMQWCYDALSKKDQWSIHYIIVPYEWSPTEGAGVRCTYRHHWNRQGAIHTARNIGSGECPFGTVMDPITRQCIEEEENQCRASNPVDYLRGEKIQSVVDLQFNIKNRQVSIERTYRSGKDKLSTSQITKRNGWRFSYDDRLVKTPYKIGNRKAPLQNAFIIDFADSRQVSFIENEIGIYEPEEFTEFSSLDVLTDQNGSIQYRTYDNVNNIEYVFDIDGRLIQKTSKNGLPVNISHRSERYIYDVIVDGEIVFTVNKDVEGYVNDIQINGSGSLEYEYDILGRMTTFVNLDNTTKTYHYENTDFPHLLTGVTDERGVRVSTWQYDSEGLANRSLINGRISETTFTYSNDASQATKNVTVHTALGATRDVKFETFGDRARPTELITEGRNLSFEYDDGGKLTASVDGNGIRNEFTYDSSGRVVLTTLAANSPDSRTISREWDPVTGRIAAIATPNKREEYLYDIQGNLSAKSIISDGESRSWSYEYNEFNQMVREDGPRIDVSDITEFEYVGGNLVTVRNALGHESHFYDYNIFGNPTRAVDANGITRLYGYDSLGRPESVEVLDPQGDLSNTFATYLTYDRAGNVTTASNSEGASLSFEYDSASRITAITNEFGDRKDIVYDTSGNVLSETLTSASAQVVKTVTKTYNAFGELTSITDALDNQRQSRFDNAGNVVEEEDPLGRVTTYTYNGLNKLSQIVDRDSNHTIYDYQNGEITAVHYNNHLISNFTYNGFGDLITVSSPETGTVLYQYDQAGNVVSKTYEGGQSTSYAYDELNRLISVDYSGTDTQDLKLIYDVNSIGNYGVGKLSRVASQQQLYSYEYGFSGKISGITFSSAFDSYNSSFQLDQDGDILEEQFDGGRTVFYGRDSSSRVTGISTSEASGSSQNSVIENIQYLSFGPVRSITFFNGIEQVFHYDQNYRMTHVEVVGSGTVLSKEYMYDANGNAEFIIDNLSSISSVAASYDSINRLVSATQGGKSWDYLFDGRASRATETVTENGINESSFYTYSSQSWLLESITSGTLSTSYQYDANGNTTDIVGAGTTLTIEYDSPGRTLSITNQNGQSQYEHNYKGQRIRKSTAQGDTYYRYNLDGSVSEIIVPGQRHHRYIYLYKMPIAIVDEINDELFAIHADHLGLTHSITDANGFIVWNANYDPFGRGSVNADPDQNGVSMTYDLRLPGQIFDSETGFHHNVYRIYDPTIGRYLQPDIIDVLGRNNDPLVNMAHSMGNSGALGNTLNMPYNYAYMNPYRYVDALGLFPAPWCPLWKRVLGICPELDDDIQPEDIPKEWIKEKLEEFKGKPCSAVEQSCKRLLGPGCYAAGTACLAPCEILKQECEKEQDCLEERLKGEEEES